MDTRSTVGVSVRSIATGGLSDKANVKARWKIIGTSRAYAFAAVFRDDVTPDDG